MDAFFPTIVGKKNRLEYHGSIVDEQLNYNIFPRGVMRKQNDKEFKYPRQFRDSYLDSSAPAQTLKDDLIAAKKPYIDFMDTKHIYQLI